MRTNLTLFTFSLPFLLSAQTPGDTLRMYFDDAGDSLQLDTVYPPGCWQVGTPNKPVFTSAYSPGKALVTDTVLPHPGPATCYAEFTIIATNPNYLGRYVMFKQRRDMDSTTSAGWVEFFGPGGGWNKIGSGFDLYTEGPATATDSGLVFTGTSSGWEDVTAYSPCMFVLAPHVTRSFDIEQRVRFVFSSSGNVGARDGWMIDNVRAAVEVCTGGIAEDALDGITLLTNPASDHVTIQVSSRTIGLLRAEFVRPDGGTVLSKVLDLDGDATIDVSALAEGLYLLRLTQGDQVVTRRIVVQR